MAKALWNGAVLAESDRCEIVENNHYFPPDAVHWDYFEDSATHTECPWKGTAHYHHIVVDGRRNQDAAWYYPDPKPAARGIKGYVAFWKGVVIES